MATHVGKSNITADTVMHVCVGVQNVGSGWWEARNSHGQVGLVPQSYFEVLDIPSALLSSSRLCRPAFSYFVYII